MNIVICITVIVAGVNAVASVNSCFTAHCHTYRTATQTVCNVLHPCLVFKALRSHYLYSFFLLASTFALCVIYTL